METKDNILDEEMLNKLSETGSLGEMLEVVDVDVRRLRDDHSEIQPEQEVAFVATFAMRITKDGITSLLSDPFTDKDKRQVRTRANQHPNAEDCWDHLGSEDKLLEVGADAELRSDKVPINEDSITSWIKKHYTFTFRLNGVDLPDDHSRSTDTPPWLKTIDIGDINGDYIDVDVRINEKPRTTEQPFKVNKAPATPQTGKPIKYAINLEVEGDISQLENLIAKPLQVVGQHGDQVSLKITLVKPRAPRPSHAGT